MMGRAMLFTAFRANVPQINVRPNPRECAAKGVAIDDVNNTLRIYQGSMYVNDFNLFGRTWQVVVQADNKFRVAADQVPKLRVRNNKGAMVPLGSLVDIEERHPADICFLPEVDGRDAGYLFVAEEHDTRQVSVYRWDPSGGLVLHDLLDQGFPVPGPNLLFLDRVAGANLSRYTGYDISEEMLTAARARCDQARSRFVLGPEVTEAADYTFVSGTFNVKLDAGDAEWDAYVKRQLEIMFAQSARGLAFNLLTTYVDWKTAQLFYADPTAYFDFCKTRLSRYVTLSHDYGLFEWTLLVTRDPLP